MGRIANFSGKYERDIAGYPILTAEEEAALGSVDTGDDEERAAKATLVVRNLRLVCKIARGFLGRGLDLDDLIGEGNLGLIRAAEDFDPRFGTRFSTYAGHWIKQAIRHALTNTTPTIRVPGGTVTLLWKWHRAERALARELGQAPTSDQVAASLGLTDARRDLVERAKRAGAIGEFVDGADHREGPEAGIAADDVRRGVAERLGRLDKRLRAVVSLRYGFDGDDLSLREVGQHIGLSYERVRQLEIQALEQLADYA